MPDDVDAGEELASDTGEGKQEHEEKDEEEEEAGDVIDPTDFPTLGLTLEEARRTYDDEERRRDTVENKIGIVVTVDALLISFGALFSDLHILALALVLAPALISAGLGLYTIRSRDYKRPGKDIDDFYQYSEYDDIDVQEEQLLLDYSDTILTNKEMNKAKFTRFNYCIALTFLSILLLLLAPVALYLWQVFEVASRLPITWPGPTR